MCRGSTGYGEDGIQSLPGNIGTNDVADCMAALDAAIAEGAGSPMYWKSQHATVLLMSLHASPGVSAGF